MFTICSVSTFIEESVITRFHMFFSLQKYQQDGFGDSCLESEYWGDRGRGLAGLSYRVRFLSHKRSNIIMPHQFNIPSETEKFIGENTAQRKLLYQENEKRSYLTQICKSRTLPVLRKLKFLMHFILPPFKCIFLEQLFYHKLRF